MIPIRTSVALGTFSLAMGIVLGWTVRDWKADAAQRRDFDALIITKDRMQRRVDLKATEFEILRQLIEPQRAEIRTTIKEVYRNVPVSADCALQPDALRMLEDARRRANAAAAGQPIEPLPTITGTDPLARP